jgi:mono/diheme cytochrome c family protein
MSMRSALAAGLVLMAGAAFAQNSMAPHLGKPVSAGDMKRWDIDIQFDGAGLPPGSGTAAQGAPLFVEKCAACHGDGGRGSDMSKRGLPAPPALVSDVKFKPIDASTTSIANYWPYAPPLFDYIRRAMPWNAPRTLSDNQVYALTAYILAESKLIDAKFVLNAKTLAALKMPNRNGFRPRFPDQMPK